MVQRPRAALCTGLDSQLELTHFTGTLLFNKTESVKWGQLQLQYACLGLPQKDNDLLFAVFAGSHIRHSPE
jgi:predicted nucleic acid-binding protein